MLSDLPPKPTSVTGLEELKVPRKGDDCLVVIYAPIAAELGRRHVLDREIVALGRDRENDIVLDSDSVSRRHARIEHREGNVYVTDLDSTNGTYINDEGEPVTECQVRRGDQIKIGDTIFKYLSGSDIETQYHEAIYTLTITDGLTGLPNERQLADVLGREVKRSRRYERPLSALIVRVDKFSEINDAFGHLSGDIMLREMAVRLSTRMREHDMVARHKGSQFVVVLPETAAAEAMRVACELKLAATEEPYTVEGESVLATVSVGCVERRDEDAAEQLVSALENALYDAKRGGGNRISQTGNNAVVSRRSIDGQMLVHKLLSREERALLIGFEIQDEILLMASRGREMRDDWYRQLERAVDAELPPGAVLGRWNERYVIAGIAESLVDPFSVVNAVRNRWATSRAGDEHRSLRAAILEPGELHTYQASALERLALKLLESPRPELVKAVEARQPFPIAASAALVRSAGSELHRFNALVHSIEMHLKLGVAAALALAEPTALDAKAISLLKETNAKPVSMGRWRDMLNLLCSGVRSTNDHPCARWLRSLGRKRKGAGQLSLLEHVSRAVQTRNDTTGHGTPMADAAYTREAEVLQQVHKWLIEASKPLEAMRLVSIARSDVLVSSDSFDYEIRDHVGESEIFALRHERRVERLGGCWMYMLADTYAPLSLSPVFFCTICDVCQRTEVFAANNLVLGPDDASVDSKGVTTNHKASLPIQWNPHERELYSLVGSTPLPPTVGT